MGLSAYLQANMLALNLKGPMESCTRAWSQQPKGSHQHMDPQDSAAIIPGIQPHSPVCQHQPQDAPRPMASQLKSRSKLHQGYKHACSSQSHHKRRAHTAHIGGITWRLSLLTERELLLVPKGYLLQKSSSQDGKHIQYTQYINWELVKVRRQINQFQMI